MLLANFDRKEHLQHRAVSLRQHGFLVFSKNMLTKWQHNLPANFLYPFRDRNLCSLSLKVTRIDLRHHDAELKRRDIMASYSVKRLRGCINKKPSCR